MTLDALIEEDADLQEIREAMAQRIPSTTYIVRALPLNNGRFQALYSAPGLIPDVAQTREGRPYEYNTEQEAEWGAAKALVGILNAPRIKANQHQGKPERYEKLNGADFAVLLQRAQITPSFFAFLYGTTQQRVLSWIDGQDNAPHPARILLELFIADPTTIDRAEEITNSVTIQRRPQEAK